MRVLETIQPDPVLGETGSNVTLTCHAAQKSEINWFFNSTYQEEPNCKNVKTCNLVLRWPVAYGNYSCQVIKDNDKCFYKVLELKVAGESRVIQVRIYYYYYYHYYYYYYYYIIIITSDTGKSKL